MGKIKQKKYSLHLSAPKTNERDYGENRSVERIESEISSKVHSSDLFQNVIIPPNLFKDTAITPEALKQKLPAYSTKDKYNLNVRKVVSSSQREELEQKLRKKYGRKKIPFSEVVSSVLDFLKKKEKDDKKKAAAILEDYGSLKDALPDLDKLMKDNKVKVQEEKPRAAKSFSRQDEEMAEDIQTYHEILNNSQYTSDPLGMISALLQQKFDSGTL